jgi:FeS assembly SUF system protein
MTLSQTPNDIEEKIITVLKTVFDPEIPANIYEMGLIYEIDTANFPHVSITMTLTSPNCPVAESLPLEVRDKVQAMEGVASCHVDLVFEPEWTTDRMSEEAKLELGLL